ncbi:MAG: hypothetical protein ABI881_15365 [Betaproteobacteria bacterium]
MLDPLHALDNRVTEAAANTSLSIEGKRNAIEKPLADAAEMIAKQTRNVDYLANERTKQQAALFSAPSIEPAAIALDIETRAAYLGLNEQGRAQINIAMQEGRADNVLHALLRAPVQAAIPPYIAAMWKARVEQLHGPKLSELAAEEEDESRTRSAITGLRNILARAQVKFTQ